MPDLLTSAEKYLGTPYKYGQNCPAGMDCSAFVQNAHKDAGFTIPRDTASQIAYAQQRGVFSRGMQDAQPGDTIYFQSPHSPSGRHTGIYAGNGEMFDASTNGVTRRRIPGLTVIGKARFAGGTAVSGQKRQSRAMPISALAPSLQADLGGGQGLTPEQIIAIANQPIPSVGSNPNDVQPTLSPSVWGNNFNIPGSSPRMQERQAEQDALANRVDPYTPQINELTGTQKYMRDRQEMLQRMGPGPQYQDYTPPPMPQRENIAYPDAAKLQHPQGADIAAIIASLVDPQHAGRYGATVTNALLAEQNKEDAQNEAVYNADQRRADMGYNDQLQGRQDVIRTALMNREGHAADAQNAYNQQLQAGDLGLQADRAGSALGSLKDLSKQDQKYQISALAARQKGEDVAQTDANYAARVKGLSEWQKERLGFLGKAFPVASTIIRNEGAGERNAATNTTRENVATIGATSRQEVAKIGAASREKVGAGHDAAAMARMKEKVKQGATVDLSKATPAQRAALQNLQGAKNTYDKAHAQRASYMAKVGEWNLRNGANYNIGADATYKALTLAEEEAAKQYQQADKNVSTATGGTPQSSAPAPRRLQGSVNGHSFSLDPVR